MGDSGASLAMERRPVSTSLLPEFALVLREALRNRGLSPTAFAITHKLDGNLLRLLARGESPPRSKAGRLPAPLDEKYREIARYLWGEEHPDAVRWLDLLREAQIAAEQHRDAILQQVASSEAAEAPRPAPRSSQEQWLDAVQLAWMTEPEAAVDASSAGLVVNELILTIGTDPEALTPLAARLRACARGDNPARPGLERLARVMLRKAEGADFAQRRRLVGLVLVAAQAEAGALEEALRDPAP